MPRAAHLRPHGEALVVRGGNGGRGCGGSRAPGADCDSDTDSGRSRTRIISSSVCISSSKSGKSDTTCSTPEPAPPRARAMPTSSSRAAVNVGVGSPRLVRWLSVRDVGEAEGAGANPFRGDAAHLRDLVGRRRLAVGTPLAHHEQAERAVAHLRGEVDVVRAAFERVQVLADAAPVPGQALVQRRAGNVLDTFHQLDELRVVGGTDGGEADAAVAHDDRGDAVAR